MRVSASVEPTQQSLSPPVQKPTHSPTLTSNLAAIPPVTLVGDHSTARKSNPTLLYLISGPIRWFNPAPNCSMAVPLITIPVSSPRLACIQHLLIWLIEVLDPKNQRIYGHSRGKVAGYFPCPCPGCEVRYFEI